VGATGHLYKRQSQSVVQQTPRKQKPVEIDAQRAAARPGTFQFSHRPIFQQKQITILISLTYKQTTDFLQRI